MKETTIVFLAIALIVVAISLTNFRFELKFTGQKEDKKQSENRIKIGRLSNTEIKVLEALSEGKPNKEIASDFSISVFTVKKHVSNIFKKLDISARKETRQFYDLIHKEEK